MIRYFNPVVICLCYIGILFSQNTDPIILIHGFLGWGRNEMAGYYYWGGKTDLEAELIKESESDATIGYLNNLQNEFVDIMSKKGDK